MKKFTKLLSLCLVAVMALSTSVFAAEQNDTFTEKELIDRVSDIYNTYLPENSWQIEDVQSEEIVKYSRDEVEEMLYDLEESLKIYSDDDIIVEAEPEGVMSRSNYDTRTITLSGKKSFDQSLSSYTIKVTFKVDYGKPGYFYHVIKIHGISSKLDGTYLGTATWKQTSSSSSLDKNDSSSGSVKVVGDLKTANTVAGITVSAELERTINLTFTLS